MNTTPKDAKPNPQTADSGGCVPMFTVLVGLGMIVIGLLAILNTAFGWELVIGIYGADLEVPKYWDSTIAVLVIGGIIAGIGWLMGRPAVVRMYRKNKLLVILGSIGLLVGVFFLLNEYDKSIKRRNAERASYLDSLEAENPEDEADPAPTFNPYQDREITIVVTNPTTDTMQVLVDGEQAFEVLPYELGKGDVTSGPHQLVAKIDGNAVETVDLDFPVRTAENVHEVTVINVDSVLNIGVLNFQDYYGDNDQKRSSAQTLNYRLESLHWGEHIFTINVESPYLCMPRQASIDFSSGNALKIVLIPEKYKDDYDKAFDFVIWKFIDEEKKGLMQDDLSFYMLSAKEQKKAIQNRLADDAARFEAEN